MSRLSVGLLSSASYLPAGERGDLSAGIRTRNDGRASRGTGGRRDEAGATPSPRCCSFSSRLSRVPSPTPSRYLFLFSFFLQLSLIPFPPPSLRPVRAIPVHGSRLFSADDLHPLFLIFVPSSCPTSTLLERILLLRRRRSSGAVATSTPRLVYRRVNERRRTPLETSRPGQQSSRFSLRARP